MGDHVFLKVMPKKEVVRFGKRGKLSPTYIWPFKVLERVGMVSYWLALSPSLSCVHAVFHDSMLRKYTLDLTHVVDWGELVVVQMEPSRKDLCVSWIAEIRFCEARP